MVFVWACILLCVVSQVALAEDFVSQNKIGDSHLHAALAKACGQHLAKDGLCPKVTDIPDHQLACLRGHRDAVEDACKKEIFQLDATDNEDVRLNKDVITACSKELGSRCNDVQFGDSRKLQCLWKQSFVTDGKQGTQFSPVCHEKIHNLTRHSLQDYRLDFGIRKFCAREIEDLCLIEKQFVDNLTITELFGSTTPAGQVFEPYSGKVISCLKLNLARHRITEDACRNEVSRAVAVESSAFGTDPVVIAACRTDLTLLCQGQPKNKVKVCLRMNVSQLEPLCRAEVELQSVLEDEDITRNPELAVACRPAIAKFCKGVQPGESRVMHCLQDKRTEEDFPNDCKNSIIAHLQSVNILWLFKYSLKAACAQEVNRLCKDELETNRLACLKQNFEKVENQRCQNELRRFVKQGVADIRLDPAAYKGCRDDITMQCPNVETGGNRVHDCLWKRRFEISPDCAKHEFEQLRLISIDAAFDTRVQTKCSSEIERFCRDFSSGELWGCLQRHMNKVDMGGECHQIVMSHTEIQHQNIHLNPDLLKFCKTDAEDNCGINFQSQEVDIRTEGVGISCLLTLRGSIKSPECIQSLWLTAKQRTSNIMLGNAAKVCEEDINSHCFGLRSSGKGEIYNCLEQRIKDLFPACRAVVTENVALRAEDIKFNPTLYRACKKEIDELCKDVPSGFLAHSSGKVACLLKHLHVAKSMSPSCTDALVEEQSLRAKSIMYNPGLDRHCQKDVENLLEASKCNETEEDGWKLHCLSENVQQLKLDSCKKKVREYMTRVAADIRASAHVNRVCGDDLTRLCPGVSLGKARGHKCLSYHVANISSNACKVFVAKQMKHQKIAVFQNYDLRMNCKSEHERFCSEIPNWQRRLLTCLATHRKQVGFGFACGNELDKLGITKELEKQSTNDQSFWERYTTFFIAGFVGIIVALGVVASHHLITRKFVGAQVQSAVDGEDGNE